MENRMCFVVTHTVGIQKPASCHSLRHSLTN